MMRILHVLYAMDRGAVESWLMHVLRALDRDRFAFDFLVHARDASSYVDEVRNLGARVVPCRFPTSPRSYAHEFRRLLGEHGPFDVVHSHVHHFSGLVLRSASQGGIPARIAHSHDDTAAEDAEADTWRQLYRVMMGQWIDEYATGGLAASGRAAACLFGPDWMSDPRWRLLPYGLDFPPLDETDDSRTLRRTVEALERYYESAIPPRKMDDPGGFELRIRR
jgi:hypothetical protein